jgi:hypothetical protein
MEELAIVRFSEVNFSLASLDVLEPDFVLQVNAPDGWWRYLLFTKSPMEHLRSLSQWQVSGFLQSGWRKQVANVLLCELWSIWRTNIKSVMKSSNNKLDKFNHSCDGFLDQLSNLKFRMGFEKSGVTSEPKRSRMT